ncbi:GNAT family N-acetyltransferase [Gallaecimonas sp. GXIMD4217]|uniref:GNAT family N-acetyltransferase n=1 Tax=Gallaecimonas sp. GXIMD4217 TaxID=3131927 RepID=UPI00311B0F1D
MSTAEAHQLRAQWLTAEDMRVAATILYQAYHDDPLFMSLFQSTKADYESRLRAAIREELQYLWQTKQRVLGLFEGDRLIAVACLVSEPQSAGKIWSWRFKMLLTAGLGSTQQWLGLEVDLIRAVGEQNFDWLAFIAVAPVNQRQGTGRLLLDAAIGASRESGASCLALVLSQPQLADFFAAQGFGVQGQLAFAGQELALLVSRGE